MKKIPIIIMIAFLAFGCKSDKNHTANHAVTSENESAAAIHEKLAPADFQTKLTRTVGAQLIDVRTPQEVTQGYIKHAQNFNFNADDFKTKVATLSKDKPIFVYCAAGGRSGKCANMLHEMGFKEVYDLKGGMGAWENAGIEVAGR